MFMDENAAIGATAAKAHVVRTEDLGALRSEGTVWMNPA
ncbi:hypothetical protein OAN307_c17300 [Octadecabacter antarcticus 307]|uniref:Uncharacterized protein n=1 Tax=Octadecabacter antarcticus 307 TaxID=391626 RepID=M9RC61_9RHOB|nr:hypothetical protein OAN307_c17300 [Octadecabacter antarcticus 307]